ncbi:amino acid ABC transporter permease [Paraburkholderia fungorum]|uniref:amino acid ABC transporter permease n=1 Tax=Paraburkholderia fungorum TaxID=134537 RepID=UPI0038B98E3F
MTYNFDFSFLSQYWPDLLRGMWLTLRMTMLSIIPGFVVGTLCALGRIYGRPWLVRSVGTYIEVIRNTPLVIQVFWLFFGLSALHLPIPALAAAVIALAINVSAYAAEIMRAGFEAIPTGQLEAASCLALTKQQTIWYVELPQAVERVYPALVSQFILMMLATSIMSQISADELTGVADVIQSFTYRGFEAYLVVAVIYLVLVSALRLFLLAGASILFPRLRVMNHQR